MNKGFSFIEIVITLAVLGIILILTMTGFSSFYKDQILNGAINQTISLANEARSKTMSSKGASQYGIHVEPSRIVFFKGTEFVESSADNKEFILPASVEIFNISLNSGGSDLVFQRLTGETDNYGTISFRLNGGASKTKIITIESSGIVNID